MAELLALCGSVAVHCAVARLQLQHRPDEGGSEEMCKQLNVAMDFFSSSVALFVSTSFAIVLRE